MYKQTYVVFDSRNNYAVAHVWDDENGEQQVDVLEVLFAKNTRDAIVETRNLGIALTHKYALPI